MERSLPKNAEINKGLKKPEKRGSPRPELEWIPTLRYREGQGEAAQED